MRDRRPDVSVFSACIRSAAAAVLVTIMLLGSAAAAVLETIVLLGVVLAVASPIGTFGIYTVGMHRLRQEMIQ